MDAVGQAGSGAYGSSSASTIDRAWRYAVRFSPASFLPARISALLEYAPILSPVGSSSYEAEGLIAGASGGGSGSGQRERGSAMGGDAVGSSGGGVELSIRIVGWGDQGGANGAGVGGQEAVGRERGGGGGNDNMDEQDSVDMDGMDGDGVVGGEEGVSPSPLPIFMMSADRTDGDVDDSVGGHHWDESYRLYDIQQVASLIDEILPFSFLLVAVLIRQNFQGFLVTIWIAAVMFKSNDILRKQTALKVERSIPVLIVLVLISTLHVVEVYWYYRNGDLMYALIMLPPKAVPPFWHAIFIIIVNDTLVRQATMVLKCMLLIYYKNKRGRNYRRQGQMLTAVEYLLLVYRALLPTPVWYSFFFNKEYGSLFSSLITGLYLTFKLASVFGKLKSFLTALKALLHKEVKYGSYAKIEQVREAGDKCAICQEEMHAPILLRCKHIFCEDCVTEWFERERSCPLCRALVKPVELKSFGDGSTSLFFQLY